MVSEPAQQDETAAAAARRRRRDVTSAAAAAGGGFHDDRSQGDRQRCEQGKRSAVNGATWSADIVISDQDARCIVAPKVMYHE